jgi:prophage tail gpP-like protein
MTQKITIKIGNNILEGFDNINISRDIEAFCGTFSFEAYSEKNIILPYAPSQSCEILVDGEIFLTGIIDSDFIGYDDNRHTYTFNGRDKTSIIVDNSIEGNVNFTAPINIVDIIQQLVVGFDAEIFVVPPVEPVNDFNEEELLSGDEGNNIFQFIEKLARQRGLLLRTDEAGDIVLEKEPGAKYNVKLLNKINGTSNNILEGGRNRDYSQRYKRYKVHSQTNLSSGIVSSPDYNITGEATDEDNSVNIDKYLEIEAEMSGNAASNTIRAEWEKKIRAARSIIYSYNVREFTADTVNGVKEFWNINRLVDVKDDFFELNEILLIKSINFSYTNDGGAITSMELVDKNAYIVGA